MGFHRRIAHPHAIPFFDPIGQIIFACHPDVIFFKTSKAYHIVSVFMQMWNESRSDRTTTLDCISQLLHGFPFSTRP